MDIFYGARTPFYFFGIIVTGHEKSTGGVFMKKAMNAIITLFTFTILSTSLYAADAAFGTIDKETQLKWQEQQVMDLVGESSDYRASINKGRSIAGQTQDELRWANEFENLMNSQEDKDYLEMALKLK